MTSGHSTNIVLCGRGGQGILFTIERTTGYSIAVLQPDTGERTVVVPDGVKGRYVETGHLVYAAPRGLTAVPFDIGRLAVTGPAVRLVDDVRRNTRSAYYATSAGGSLVYVTGGVGASGRRLQQAVWSRLAPLPETDDLARRLCLCLHE